MDKIKNEIYSLLLQNISERKIEERLKISRKKINRILKDANISKSIIKDNIKNKIIEMYNNETKVKDIAKKFNTSISYIGNIISQKGLKRKNPLNMCKRYKAEEHFINDGISYFKKKCNCCNEIKIIQVSGISIKNKDSWYCIDCYLNTNKINDSLAKQKLRCNNTTGYTGVCIKQEEGKIKGYMAVIYYKKEKILNNLYTDDTLNNKTLIQAVLDRDIFIIEHKLPHRRNFTDLELFANMEYLAYDNINTLKEILQQN